MFSLNKNAKGHAHTISDPIRDNLSIFSQELAGKYVPLEFHVIGDVDLILLAVSQNVR